ncbi:MAG: hypothetical protein AB7V56_10220 [Candidatus Nitrosocosmicus sp.]
MLNPEVFGRISIVLVFRNFNREAALAAPDTWIDLKRMDTHNRVMDYANSLGITKAVELPSLIS